MVIGCEGDADKALADDDALDPFDVDPFRYGLVRGIRGREVLSNRLLYNALDVVGGYSRDRAGRVFSPAQSHTDIKSVAAAILARKARAHAIALVVKSLSHDAKRTVTSLLLSGHLPTIVKWLFSHAGDES